MFLNWVTHTVKIKMLRQMTLKRTVQKGSWGEVQTAFAGQFGDDLNLVGHPMQQKLELFFNPWPGVYSLTTLDGVTEADVYNQMSGEKLALAIGCMDKRYALPFFNWAVKKSKGQVVVPIYIAAGVAQVENDARQMALKQLITWLCKNGDVARIWASGHCHNCGGLGYLCYDGKATVCEALRCKPGSGKEARFVKGEIRTGVFNIVPKTHWGRTQKVLVTERRGQPHMITFR